jgi:hypothetical protein
MFLLDPPDAGTLRRSEPQGRATILTGSARRVKSLKIVTGAQPQMMMQPLRATVRIRHAITNPIETILLLMLKPPDTATRFLLDPAGCGDIRE